MSLPLKERSNPCKDCDKREIGCHDKCTDFKEWQEAHIERKRAIKNQILKENQVRSFKLDRYLKEKKRRKK